MVANGEVRDTDLRMTDDDDTYIQLMAIPVSRQACLQRNSFFSNTMDPAH